MARQNQEQKARKLTFRRRLKNIKKKAGELVALCSITACFMCYGPNGQVSTWPENSDEVKSLIRKYKRQFPLAENGNGNDNGYRDLAAKIKRLEKGANALRKERLSKIMRLTHPNLDGLRLSLESTNDSNEEDRRKEGLAPPAARDFLSLMGR